jgi:hypothetical protein
MRALFALFIRSLREDTRAKLPPILRTALVVIILLILWANQRDFAAQSAPGRELLLIVMMLNASFLAVAAVSIFPSAITEEKEDETLPLLRMTNLNPLSILLGKAAPRLLSAMLLLAVQIPFTLLAITLGGVTMAQVLGAYAILAATAVFLCGLALFASVYCRTAMRAGFLTGVVGGVFYVGLPLLGIATALHRMRPGALSSNNFSEAFFVWVMEANPVYGIIMLLERSMSGAISTVVWSNLAGGVLFAGLAWLLFDRYCTQVGEGVARPRKIREGRPRRRWAGVSRAWRWALVWKDFHFMVGGRAGFLLRCGLAAIMFFCAYGYVRWIDSPGAYRRYLFNYSERFWREVGEITLVVAAFTAGLEVLLLASRIFGVERRRLTLSSLVSLPWGTWRLIWQKIVGCLPALLPWVVLAIVSVMMLWAPLARDIERGWDEFSWEAEREEIAVLLYVALQGILSLLVIVWFSLRIRRGALPAAIAVMAVWNILFGIWVDSVRYDHEGDIIFVGVFLTVPAIIAMGKIIGRRLHLAAAED